MASVLGVCTWPSPTARPQQPAQTELESPHLERGESRPLKICGRSCAHHPHHPTGQETTKLQKITGPAITCESAPRWLDPCQVGPPSDETHRHVLETLLLLWRWSKTCRSSAGMVEGSGQGPCYRNADHDRFRYHRPSDRQLMVTCRSMKNVRVAVRIP